MLDRVQYSVSNFESVSTVIGLFVILTVQLHDDAYMKLAERKPRIMLFP